MTEKNQFQFTIEAKKKERHYWADLWRYRELFYILAWRDISVRSVVKTNKSTLINFELAVA